MRKFFVKIHLWLSIPLGLVVSIICLSGASLVFEQEITRVLHPHLYRINPSTGVLPLSPSRLVACIREQMPDSLQLTGIQFSADPRETCMAVFRNTGRQMLSVNPYTGEVNGWTKSYSFFQTMRKLHRWLMNPPASKGAKSVGKFIVGVTTLLTVVILASGLVIWFPRSRKAWKGRLKVSCTRGWRRLWYDSHVVLGGYAAVLLLLMALTGLTWSFGWYRTAAYSIFGGSLQQNPVLSAPAEGNTGCGNSKGQEGLKGHEAAQHPFDYAVWDQVWQELRVHYPVYKTITLREKNAQVAPEPSSYMRRTDIVLFDLQNGKIKEISRYRDVPRSQSLKGWFYAFHTGSWGGIWTRVLYFLAALTGGMLPLTGYYLWWKKK